MVLSVWLHAHGSSDVRPRVIALKLKVLIFEVEQVLDIGVQLHLGQRARCARELQVSLLKVVEVEVSVACGVYKIASLKPCYLSHHHEQQSIRSDVERHTEEGIGRTLVELKRQSAVGNIKLEEAMAGRQRHLFYLRRVPSAHDHASRVGMVLYLVKHILYLVDSSTVVVGP